MIESMKTGTKFAIGAAIVVVTAGWLMATGIKQSGQYFLTPTELSRKVATDPGFYDVGMKVGAHVVPGLVVREGAILRSPEGPYVLVATNERHTLTKRRVEVGSIIYGYASIISGLEEDEWVVALHAFQLDTARLLG